MCWIEHFFTHWHDLYAQVRKAGLSLDSTVIDMAELISEPLHQIHLNIHPAIS
jgi:hypothetical protein